jgi:hypothetical protein
MPCRVDDYDYPRPAKTGPTQAEYDKIRTLADKLTHENDELRETLINLMADPEYKVPAKFKKLIEKAQVDHRQKDLDRLKRTFTTARDAEKLGLVMLADPKKPLEPQLGFDADDF